jgi:PhoH-like ATPase
MFLSINAKTAAAFYSVKDRMLKLVKNDTVFGIIPRNIEQSFAFDALLNPAIKLVTIQKCRHWKNIVGIGQCFGAKA